MRLRFAPLLAAAFALGVSGLTAPRAAAQSLPPLGQPGTFDVVTWNVEFFGNSNPGRGPSDDALQFRNVLETLRQGQADLWGLQEVTSPATFARLADSLALGGLQALLGPSVSSNPDFDQRLAYVYDPAVVTPLAWGAVLQSAATYFGGRAPFQLEADVTVGGRTERVVFINIHAKAGTTAADYTDRQEGAARLKSYIDNVLVFQGKRVVVVGDYNDKLLSSTVSGRPSPYLNFRNDAGYRFATEPMEAAGTPTYCNTCFSCSVIPGVSACEANRLSTRDHLLLTANLLPFYVEGATARYEAVLDGFDNTCGSSNPLDCEFVYSTSDHLPVVVRFDLGMGTPAEDGAPPRTFGLRDAAPNPFTTTAALGFTLDAAGPARLELFDALGRRVAVLHEGVLAAGPHAVEVDGRALPPGLYLARLTAGGRSATRPLVRTD